jgi:hypothetical protein
MRLALALVTLLGPAFGQNAADADVASLRARLLPAVRKHLDMLVDQDGRVVQLKGKSSDAMTASAFQIAFELTGEPRYHAAAVQLADRIVRAMRATRFGVLYIKEKENPGGKSFPGGGPPAMGWYTAAAADILHRHGGRDADVKYIAGVLDWFPWNEKGWWSADIDIRTGESKQPLSKPSPINKNVAMAAAAARVAHYVRGLDPALSARLRRKAGTCVYNQILPAQESDGFWHYGLTGNDPKNKDILGYFMVTMDGLIQLREFTDLHTRPAFPAAFEKAGAFAARCIAPLADPHRGPGCAGRTTPATPTHYDVAEDPRRGFQLALTLAGAFRHRAAIEVLETTLPHFAYGERGSEGAHAVHPCALILHMLRRIR